MSDTITDFLSSYEWNTINTLKAVGLFLLGLYAFNYIYTTIHDYVMMKKLGAFSPRLMTDHCFGFKLLRTMLKEKNEGSLIRRIHERMNEVNSLTSSIYLTGSRTISTRDPENIKAILATQFNDFALGQRHTHFLPLLGDGIFTLDGQGWKHSRAMLRPQFSREQVAHVKSLEKHVQRFCKHVKVSRGEVLDLQKLFFRLTLDSATEFLMGESVESLRDSSIGEAFTEEELFSGREEFATNFDTAQRWLSVRVLAQRFYWLINPKQFKDATKGTHKLINHYVDIALECPQDELEKRSADGYVFMYELVKQTRDPKVLRDQVLNILLAGRDTTAGLLSFTFFELSRRPDILKKLKEEIFENFGSGDDARIDEITFESMKRCEYLKAVLNELLRLYPSVPVNFRVSTKDTTLPRGGGKDGLQPVYVPKGIKVTYAVSSTHRMKAYYGEDADEYRPERWFEPESRKLGWAYLPFNGGPRICLGQQFALTEASYVVIRLLQSFEHLESASSEVNDAIPLLNSNLTMSLKKGCPVKFY